MVAWTSYGLDMKDYMIFLRLEQNPSDSNAAIAKEVGLSTESVRMRRHNIKEQGFLRPDKIITDPLFGERLQTEVESVYSPYNLGLTRQHVLFKDVPDRDVLNKLKLLCDEHPYTHYRVVAFGKNATLYVQFDIPPSITSTMNTLYSELAEYGLFKECLVVDGKFVTRNKADFTKWDVDSKEWELELERKSGRGSKTSRVEKVWGQIHKQPVDDKLEESNPTMACTLDMLDMHLLRELTINAHPKI
ncbi:MAG: AsnC family protein, partial [Candidatus Thorarchaeota archaeon]